MAAFDELWSRTRPAFSEDRLFERARRLALSSLVCLGRRTVAGMLAAGGRAFCDWSADYRLFERSRLEARALFAPARRELCSWLGPAAPLSVMLDDTLLRKAGRKVHGAQHFRDPLGPKFHLNLAWSQRFLQLSAALPDPLVQGRARGVPIALRHCPLPRKPGPKASEERLAEHRQERQAARLGLAAAEELRLLRGELDQDGQAARRVICSGDGGHTNKTLLRELPERTAFIGRIRKDARLFAPPDPAHRLARGRRPCYGKALPTPEAMRKDDAIAWQSVRAFAAGKEHDFKVKSVGPLRWRAAGARDLQLVVIAPLGYRLRAGSPLLFREPAYLICTAPELALAELLQNYLWRWQIEVNFREEKTALGLGEAQVRTEAAAASVPALQAAAYATLLLAVHRACPRAKDSPLPAPLWQKPKADERLSTAKALGLLRAELWGAAIAHFSAFAPRLHLRREAREIHSALPAALSLAST